MIAHTPVGSRYTKHIDVRLMFLKELCRDRKVFDIVFAESRHNYANHNTKHAGRQLFSAVRDVYKGLSRHHPALKAKVMARFSEMDFSKARAATAADDTLVLYTHTVQKSAGE
jgi:hypothetical protein